MKTKETEIPLNIYGMIIEKEKNKLKDVNISNWIKGIIFSLFFIVGSSMFYIVRFLK